MGDQQIDFFDSGYSYNSNQESSAYNYSEQGQGADYSNYGGHDYNSAPGYGGQAPSILTPNQQNYGYENQMKQAATSDYSNFEDEPPLLEGNTLFQSL